MLHPCESIDLLILVLFRENRGYVRTESNIATGACMLVDHWYQSLWNFYRTFFGNF